MAIRIEAMQRLMASDWFEGLSEAQQDQYIKDHPGSKFSKEGYHSAGAAAKAHKEAKGAGKSNYEAHNAAYKAAHAVDDGGSKSADDKATADLNMQVNNIERNEHGYHKYGPAAAAHSASKSLGEDDKTAHAKAHKAAGTASQSASSKWRRAHSSEDYDTAAQHLGTD